MGIRIGLIGYGEVGRIFARDLLTGGADRVGVYDLLFDAPDGPDRRSAAAADGASPVGSVAEACRDAAIVVSAVTAASSETVATAAAPFLTTGQIFFDINSASPSTKKRSAERVEASGASFVEGAVMASVPGPRLRVPILGGGPDAGRAAALLNPLGMNISPVTSEAGRASAIKLCRSIVIKGLEALLTDCASAAKLWDVEDAVFESLAATFPAIDWPALSADMQARVRLHGIRRAAEMREAAQMLEELGLDPGLARATAERQEAVARKASLRDAGPTTRPRETRRASVHRVHRSSE